MRVSGDVLPSFKGLYYWERFNRWQGDDGQAATSQQGNPNAVVSTDHGDISIEQLLCRARYPFLFPKIFRFKPRRAALRLAQDR